jgi:hypothetical protein
LQAIEEYDSDSDDIELDITSSPLQCGDNQVFINPLLLEESECDESESLTFSITCDNDSEIVINPSLLQESLFESNENEFNDLVDSSLEHVYETNDIVAEAHLYKTVATFLYLLMVSILLLSETVSSEMIILVLLALPVMRSLIQLFTNKEVGNISDHFKLMFPSKSFSHGVSFRIKKRSSAEKKSLWNYTMTIP